MAPRTFVQTDRGSSEQLSVKTSAGCKRHALLGIERIAVQDIYTAVGKLRSPSKHPVVDRDDIAENYSYP